MKTSTALLLVAGAGVVGYFVLSKKDTPQLTKTQSKPSSTSAGATILTGLVSVGVAAASSYFGSNHKTPQNSSSPLDSQGYFDTQPDDSESVLFRDDN